MVAIGGRRRGRLSTVRILRRLVVVLLMLAGLLVAVDRVGAYAASKLAAREARDQGAQAANVRILGFPFLTQVARGDLRAVTISERQVTGNGLTFASLSVVAHGVHVSVGDAVRGRVRDVPIDRADGVAVLTYATLSTSILSALDVGSTFSLTLKPAGTGTVEATLSGPLGLSLSQQVPVPTVAGGRLQLGEFVRRFAPVLPAGVAADITVGLPSLPYGLTVSSATAEPDGLQFAVSGRDVTVHTS
jgi:hypothetical protein